MRSKLNTVLRLLQLERIDAKDLCVITFAGKAALHDAGAAPATINATLCALKGVARAAWQIGILSAEDLEKVRDIRSTRGSRLGSGQAHTPKEIEEAVSACLRDPLPAGVRDAAIIAVEYCLGLRRSECSSLDLGDYSPTSQTIIVKGKGDKERPAYAIDKGAIAALAEWLVVRSLKPGPLFCPVTKEGKVILRRLTDQAIYNAIKKRGREAGIQNFAPHNLRRTFATELLERGADIAIVQRLMGHASIETTKLYDRRGDPAHRRAASLLQLPYENQRQPELPFRGPPKRKEPRDDDSHRGTQSFPNASLEPNAPQSRPSPRLSQQTHPHKEQTTK